MTANIYAKPSGTQVALQLNGADAVVYDATGIVSGVNKSAVTQQATLGTAIATTSGTSHDFTGIPSWVKRITVMFNQNSTNGTSPYLIQIGSGSVDTSGYVSYADQAGTRQTSTAGFVAIRAIAASDPCMGQMVLTLVGSNGWVASGILAPSVTSTNAFMGGAKTLSGALDRIRLTTVNGTDTFDAGSINILYE